MVPMKKDLKKLLEGPSRNFWYGVESNKYLKTSDLGAYWVMVEKLRRDGWRAL